MSDNLRQTLAVTLLNLRSLPHRFGSSLVTVVGIAGVVAVLLSVVALSSGFRRTIDSSASADRAIILNRGSGAEAASALPRETIAAILDAQGIQRNKDGAPLASAETLMIAPVSRKSDGLDAYVTLRGVGPAAMELRPEVKLTAGRMFDPAVHELIVGRAARDRFAGLEIGNRITLRGGEWTVVGTFESSGSVIESGLLADAETVRAAYSRREFNSVIVRLSSPEAFAAFERNLALDPTLDIDVKRETEYVSTVSRPLHRILQWLSYSIGTIMSVGALFGALNTLYFAVSARSREIATLRALGFNSASVVVSVLAEALLLSLLGAAIGVAIAYTMFNGQAISTIGGTIGGSQLVYQLQITPQLMTLGVCVALLVGLIGGLFPSIRAARSEIVSGLRSL